jgi:hypothetical protein
MANETQREPQTGTESVGGGSGRGGDGSGTSDFARETARQIWDETKQDVRAGVEERRKAAASQIENFADALRDAAGSNDASSTSAHIAEGTAEALDRISQTLRSKEIGTIVHDLESMARRQPALFLGAAVAVGFVAVRFLKSSGER